MMVVKVCQRRVDEVATEVRVKKLMIWTDGDIGQRLLDAVVVVAA